MPKIDVGITDDGLVVETITDDENGNVLQVPMLAHEAFTLGENLIKGAQIVQRRKASGIIVPHPAILGG